jgi:PTHB1 C-terminus
MKDMNPDPSMTNAIALEHLNGSNVTILASRQTNKYRLQSGTLSAMALPLSVLVQRLCVQLTDLRLSLDSPLPTQELWSHVEAHYHTYTQWFDSKV